MTASEIKTWKKFVRTREPKLKETLSLQYIPLVKYIVGRISIHLPPAVDPDDLLGSGVLGLMDAIGSFDPNLGVKFSTYAVPRIRGAIMDELRSIDWVPRSLRREARELESVLSTLEHKLGRSPEESEIAEEMDIDITDYRDLLGKLSPISIFSLDKPIPEEEGDKLTTAEIISDPQAPTVSDVLEQEETKAVLTNIIDSLQERERLIVALYYYEELTLKEIGQVLEISESRVSQIHTESILRLRAGMKEVLAL